MIKELIHKYLFIWWKTKSELHIDTEKISFTEKIKNEKRIETFRKKLFKALKELPQNKMKRKT